MKAFDPLEPLIETAKTVRSLTLSNCYLTEVPPQVWSLHELERLDLSNNSISELSPNIAQLTSLRELWLNSNPLGALPQDIEHCQQLQVIDLRDTNIDRIPKQLSRIPSLVEVDLRGNAVKSTQSHAYKKGTRKLLEHLTVRDERRLLKDQMERKLLDIIYRDEADTPGGYDQIIGIVKEMFLEIETKDDLRTVLRNAERIFPEQLKDFTFGSIREGVKTIKESREAKALGADLELKLRAIYFDRIEPPEVEAMIKDIFSCIVSLRDRRFLLRYAPSLFPSNPQDVHGKDLLNRLQAHRASLMEERNKAISAVARSLKAIYPDQEPGEVLHAASSVAKLIKKTEHLLSLAADAEKFFPTEFTSMRPKAILREFKAFLIERGIQ